MAGKRRPLSHREHRSPGAQHGCHALTPEWFDRRQDKKVPPMCPTRHCWTSSSMSAYCASIEDLKPPRPEAPLPSCWGRLHRDRYPRKPRGGPGKLGEAYRPEFHLLDCDKRRMPRPFLRSDLIHRPASGPRSGRQVSRPAVHQCARLACENAHHARRFRCWPDWQPKTAAAAAAARKRIGRRSSAMGEDSRSAADRASLRIEHQLEGGCGLRRYAMDDDRRTPSITPRMTVDSRLSG